VYAFRERLRECRKLPSRSPNDVAQDATSAVDTLIAAYSLPPPGAPYVIDSKENRIGPSRRMTPAEWDELIGIMRERRIAALDANGLMTDAALALISTLDHVTALSLGGSRELTDDGLLHLARMPQLEYLNLSEYPGGKLTIAARSAATPAQPPQLK
jgi:hypothetical protein